MDLFNEEEKEYLTKWLKSYKYSLENKYQDIIKEMDLIMPDSEVPIEDDIVALAKAINDLLEDFDNWNIIPHRIAGILFMIMDEVTPDEGLGNDILEKLGYMSYTKELTQLN
jgi:hypothetical protein